MRFPPRVTSGASWVRIALLLIVVGIEACGSDSSSNNSNVTGPAGTTSGPTCRTYPTAANVETVSQGVTFNALLTGAFNTGSKTSTVTTAFVNGAACTTSVSTYTSVADFVNEVRVIPGVSLQTSTTTTNAGSCGSGTATATLTYDSQQRLVTSSSAGVATTYTAWDSSGRPTKGGFGSTTISNAYDDATRTWTQTQTGGGTTSSAVSTFDANGNQLKVVNTTNGVVSTTTFTTTNTAQVCK